MTQFDRPVEWTLDSQEDIEISDDELTTMALAAGADSPLGADAVPLHLGPSYAMLGSWYMAPISTKRLSGWRMPVVIAIVATLVALEALGLCSIFGQVVIG